MKRRLSIFRTPLILLLSTFSLCLQPSIVSASTSSAKGQERGSAMKVNTVVDFFVDTNNGTCEDYRQCQEVAKALNDMLTQPISELRKLKYYNFTFERPEWNLPMLLDNYFQPTSVKKYLHLSEEAFYRDVKKPEAQKVIRKLFDIYSIQLKDKNNYPPTPSDKHSPAAAPPHG